VGAQFTQPLAFVIPVAFAVTAASCIDCFEIDRPAAGHYSVL
jgi:hypothetical protein